MILREWRGRARPSAQDRYPEHFRDNVLPHLKQINGFIGATLSRRPLGEFVEYLVLSRWQSLDAIKAFAGSDYAKAVVEPEATAALVSFDAAVQHYEVVAER